MTCVFVIPSAEEVNACVSFHDSINRWILIETRAKRLGVYGLCPVCHGKGEGKLPRKRKKAHQKWQSFDPPTGPGYQLWETCTEGSPFSPVFASPEELADWCEDNATVFAGEKTSRQQWLAMFSRDRGLTVETGSLMVGEGNYVGSIVNLLT